MSTSPTRAPAPPPLTAKFIRYILGFSVSVSIGLAPYLGKVDVPGFASLLKLLPDTLQPVAIPLSSTTMGLLAIAVQWQAEERTSAKRRRRRFTMTMTVTLLLFVIFFALRTLLVVDVPVFAGQDSAAFLVGFSRPLRPPCQADVSDAECIKMLSFDPARIESFWGDRQTRTARLLLTFSYVAYMSGFGALVGLLVLRNRNA